MENRTGKDEEVSFPSLVPPNESAICTKPKKPELIPRASSLPPCDYPKVITGARRLSTRTILKLVLDTLRDEPERTGQLNVSSLARVTNYSRPTVDRALAFGIRFKIIERVVIDRDWPSLKEHHAPFPQVYKSLWKLSSPVITPSLKKSFKVQALASTKTGLTPSKNLKTAAMTKIRPQLEVAGQVRLTSAYGKYVWSKAATVAGISLLVRTASAMINDRTKTLPIRDAFAVVMQKINLACRPLDATEHYLATLKREALPDDIDDLFKKPVLANVDTYVEKYNYISEMGNNITPEPQPKFEGALTSTINGCSISQCSTEMDKSTTPDEKLLISDLISDERRRDSPVTDDEVLQRSRTVIRSLTARDGDVDVRPRVTSDVDRGRPRVGPRAAHGGDVPRPFGPRRATRRDDERPRSSKTRSDASFYPEVEDQHGGLKTTFPLYLKGKTTDNDERGCDRPRWCRLGLGSVKENDKTRYAGRRPRTKE